MTLFTLYQIPDARWGVRTLHLASVCIGGMGYFPTSERALAVLADAYKTPLVEVDGAAFREAMQRVQVRQAVVV